MKNNRRTAFCWLGIESYYAMKIVSLILSAILIAAGLIACDRVREDDARKGIPHAVSIRPDEKAVAQ